MSSTIYRILTPEEKQLKGDIYRINLELSDIKTRLSKQLKKCNHLAPKLSDKDRWGEYDSQRCVICDKHLGWGCDKSPDRCCHYFSTEENGIRGVQLYEGLFIPLVDIDSEYDPNDYNPNWETDDVCLFCHSPDERK